MLLAVFSVLIIIVIFAWVLNIVCYWYGRKDNLSKKKFLIKTFVN